jgi:hypothetical protein
MWILIIFLWISASLCADDIDTFIQAFEHNSCMVLEGSDAELRPVVVNLQADFERAIVQGLKSKSIVRSCCIIHTPAPATIMAPKKWTGF